MSICPEQLKSFDYYKKKLPLYLQNSHGFQEHFRIWYDMLVGYSYDGITDEQIPYTGIIQVGDTILSLLDIFNSEVLSQGEYKNYFLEKLLTLENVWGDVENDRVPQEVKIAHPYGTQSDILDKLGSIYAVERRVSLTYSYFDNDTQQNVQVNNESIELDNQEFLTYIMLQIINNYCDGTYEQLQEYYSSIGLNLYITTSQDSATASLYLIRFTDSQTTDLTNIQKLFLAGKLRIQSMGIRYDEESLNLDLILVWDNGKWGENLWL